MTVGTALNESRNKSGKNKAKTIRRRKEEKKNYERKFDTLGQQEKTTEK
jgi:hypothetical protein